MLSRKLLSLSGKLFCLFFQSFFQRFHFADPFSVAYLRTSFVIFMEQKSGPHMGLERQSLNFAPNGQQRNVSPRRSRAARFSIISVNLGVPDGSGILAHAIRDFDHDRFRAISPIALGRRGIQSCVRCQSSGLTIDCS